MTVECKQCSHEGEVNVFPRFYKNPKGDDPKYLFHVRANCKECLSFIKFVGQTPEVMEEIERVIENTFLS